MVDNGELPSVGMDILHKHQMQSQFTTSAVVAITREYIIVQDKFTEHEQHYYLNDMKFKPIETRTDKEKAIDDLGILVGDCESDYGILQAIIKGKIHGVEWVGE